MSIFELLLFMSLLLIFNNILSKAKSKNIAISSYKGVAVFMFVLQGISMFGQLTSNGITIQIPNTSIELIAKIASLIGSQLFAWIGLLIVWLPTNIAKSDKEKKE